MAEVLAADIMDDGKTVTSVAAVMRCKLLTDKGVLRLPLSLLWGNIVDEWVNMPRKHYPGVIGEEWGLYLLQAFIAPPLFRDRLNTT